MHSHLEISGCECIAAVQIYANIYRDGQSRTSTKVSLGEPGSNHWPGICYYRSGKQVGNKIEAWDNMRDRHCIEMLKYKMSRQTVAPLGVKALGLPSLL